VGRAELPARTAWLSHDRRLLALAGGCLRVFDLRTRRCVRVLAWVHGGNITVGAFSPDGRYVAADSYADSHSDAAGRFVQVWDLHSKWRYHHYVFEPRWRGQGDAGGIAFTPDNRLLAFSADSGVELLSMEEGESVAQYDPGPSITTSLRVSPSGRSLEVMSFDGQLARVAAGSGRVLQRLAAPEGSEVRACTVGPRNVAAGVAGKSVLLWSLPAWEED
jgi:WD40 repeat protein